MGVFEGGWPTPTAEESEIAKIVRRRLDYCPDSGQFTWKQDSTKPLNWNRKMTGARAGTVSTGGHVQISVDGKRHQAHRLAYLWMTGVFPPEEVDHINGNRTDNRWENLRPATRKENMQNRKRPKNNSSGVVGVSWEKRSNRWRVNVCGQYIGLFEDFNEACIARQKAAVIEGLHDNHGRAK